MPKRTAENSIDLEGRDNMAYAKRRKYDNKTTGSYKKNIFSKSKAGFKRNASKRYGSKKRSQQHQVETLTCTCAGVPILRNAANDTQLNFVCKADMKNLYVSGNTSLLACKKAEYEEFRIARVTYHFRLTAASTVTDPTEDSIITLFNSYDDNCFTKKYASINEITKDPNYKRRVMMPFKDYVCVLYPKWSEELVVGTGDNKIKKTTKSGVWMNTLNIDTANVFSSNGIQVGINGFNTPLPATKKTIVELQEYVTYQFRKKMNHINYAP